MKIIFHRGIDWGSTLNTKGQIWTQAKNRCSSENDSENLKGFGQMNLGGLLKEIGGSLVGAGCRIRLQSDMGAVGGGVG